MFDSLSNRLNDVFDRLRGRGALGEDDVTAALREIRIALLEADVALPVVRDFVASVYRQGFRRVLIVNGHGGNAPAQALTGEWMADHPGVRIKFHNWWNAPRVWAQVQAIDPVASHASWMENFPWTRLAAVKMPSKQKPMSDLEHLRQLDPQSLRAYLGDGNYGGHYQRDDEEMLKIWQVGVVETRALLTESWA